MILGPRGNTLKALERETGAKIIIRGKGSVKEGKLAIAYQNSLPGADEDLHAWVSATSEKCIKDACDKIRDIINSALQVPDGQNHLRQLQLRELALLNGTLRPEDLLAGNRCSNCGASDHKTWECSEAANITAGTICMRCGAAGHISRDCKGTAPGEAAGQILDEEYSALMAELGEGGGVGGGGGGGDGQSYGGGGGFRGGYRGRGNSFFPRGGFMPRGGGGQGFGRGLGRNFFDGPDYGKPKFEGGADAVSSIKEELSKIKTEGDQPAVVRINLASRPKPQPLMSISTGGSSNNGGGSTQSGPPPMPPPPPWGWPPMPVPPGMPMPPGMPPMPPPGADPSMMPYPPWGGPGMVPPPGKKICILRRMMMILDLMGFIFSR